ncbi:MAG TPA: hypothetical protein VF299_11740 [Mycobacterium sp.]
MNAKQNRRRGTVLGVSALAGLGIAALGAVGIASHEGVAAQQRDVALTAGYVPPNPEFDDAHEALINGQTAQLQSYFDQNVIGLQESYYYFAQAAGSPTFSGDAADPADSVFNGAFTRFFEAQEVSQAIQQAQWDHLLGVNATLGGPDGTDVSNLYESQIANVLNTDIGGSAPSTTIATDLANMMTTAAGVDGVVSASQFSTDLTTLQSDLMQNAVSDFFGMFSVSDVA